MSSVTAVTIIRRLHDHRIWSTNRFLDACSALDAASLHKTFAIGQGTIWSTLLHLHAADYVWLEALHGSETPLLPGDSPDRLPGNQLGDRPIGSIAELTSRWKLLDQRWLTYLETLHDGMLSDQVAKISTSSGYGKRHLTPTFDILLHLCTHSQYTLAQGVNMLRQVGVDDLPDLMLITMSRMLVDVK